MWVGDVDLDEMPAKHREICLAMLRRIRNLQDENEELRRHLRGQSRKVTKLMKEKDPDQMEFEIDGRVI